MAGPSTDNVLADIDSLSGDSAPATTATLEPPAPKPQKTAPLNIDSVLSDIDSLSAPTAPEAAPAPAQPVVQPIDHTLFDDVGSPGMAPSRTTPAAPPEVTQAEERHEFDVGAPGFLSTFTVEEPPEPPPVDPSIEARKRQAEAQKARTDMLEKFAQLGIDEKRGIKEPTILDVRASRRRPRPMRGFVQPGSEIEPGSEESQLRDLQFHFFKRKREREELIESLENATLADRAMANAARAGVPVEDIQASQGERELNVRIQLAEEKASGFPLETDRTPEERIEDAKVMDAGEKARGLDRLAEVPGEPIRRDQFGRITPQIPSIEEQIVGEMVAQKRETTDPGVLGRFGKAVVNAGIDDMDEARLAAFLDSPQVDALIIHRIDAGPLELEFARRKAEENNMGLAELLLKRATGQLSNDIKREFAFDNDSQTGRLVRFLIAAKQRSAFLADPANKGKEPLLAFRMTPPKGFAAKAAQVGGGLFTKIVKLAIARGAVPPQMQGKTLGTALQFVLSEPFKDPKGEALFGAVLGLAGSVGQAGGKVAKAGILAGEATAFAAITKKQGGDFEDVMIAALIPVALAGLGAVKKALRPKIRAIEPSQFNKSEQSKFNEFARRESLKALGFDPLQANPPAAKIKAARSKIANAARKADASLSLQEANSQANAAVDFLLKSPVGRRGGVPSAREVEVWWDPVRNRWRATVPAATAKPAPAAKADIVPPKAEVPTEITPPAETTPVPTEPGAVAPIEPTPTITAPTVPPAAVPAQPEPTEAAPEAIKAEKTTPTPTEAEIGAEKAVEGAVERVGPVDVAQPVAKPEKPATIEEALGVPVKEPSEKKPLEPVTEKELVTKEKHNGKTPKELRLTREAQTPSKIAPEAEVPSEAEASLKPSAVRLIRDAIREKIPNAVVSRLEEQTGFKWPDAVFAALSHPDIKKAIQAGEVNPSEIVKRPPMLIRFENGVVWGPVPENVWGTSSLAGWERKLGKLQDFDLIDAEDPVLGVRTPYATTGGVRFENFQRRSRLKKNLGKKLATFVTHASRGTLKGFRRDIQNPDADVSHKTRIDESTGRQARAPWNTPDRVSDFLKTIKVLGYTDEAHFWRVVKGKKPIPLTAGPLFGVKQPEPTPPAKKPVVEKVPPAKQLAPGFKEIANAAVVERAGSEKVRGIVKHHIKQNPKLKGIKIGSLKETKESGPLSDAAVAKIHFKDGVFVPKKSGIYVTPDVSPITVRHEIEHLLDAIEGFVGDPSNPTFTKFSHENFIEEFAKKALAAKPKPVVAEKKAEPAKKRIISEEAVADAWKVFGETKLRGGLAPLDPKLIKAAGTIVLAKFETGVRKLGGMFKAIVPALKKRNSKMTTALARRYVRRAWRDTIPEQKRIIKRDRQDRAETRKEARRVKIADKKAFREAEKISKPTPAKVTKAVVSKQIKGDIADRKAQKVLNTRLGELEKATAKAWVESAKDTISQQKDLADHVDTLLKDANLTPKQTANLVRWVVDTRTPGERAKRLAQIQVMVSKSALTVARKQLRAINKKAIKSFGRDFRKLRPALRDAMREISDGIVFRQFTKRQTRSMQKTADFFRENPDLEMPVGAVKAIQALGQKSIAEMQLQELQSTTEGMKAILHQQKLIDRLLNKRQKRRVNSVVREIRKTAGKPEIDESGKVVPVERNWLARTKDYLTRRLETNLMALDGGKPGIATELIYQETLREGSNDYHRLSDPDEGQYHVKARKILNKHGIDTEQGLDDWFVGGMAKPKVRTVKLPNGSTVTTTKSGMVAFLMTLRDDQGQGGKALLQNPRGFFLIDPVPVKRPKTPISPIPEPPPPRQPRARLSEYTKPLGDADIQALTEAATQEELEAAKAMREIMDFLAKEGNSVSVEVYGFEKFTNPTYWPRQRQRADISTEDKTLDVALDFVNSDSVTNWSATKERTGGFARLRVQDAFVTLNEHIRHIAMLKAMGPRIRDLKLIMGNSIFAQAVKTKLGDKGIETIRTHVRRSLLETVRPKDPIESFLGKQRGRAAKAILIINPSVIVAQATSFFHAMNEMGLGLLKTMRPLSRAEKKKVAEVKSLRISPDLFRRNKGLIGRDIGEVMIGREMSRSFNDNPDRLLDKLTKPMRKSDQIPVDRIIVKALQEGRKKGLSGDDLLFSAAKRSEFVVRWTQPAFAPMDRTLLGGTPNQAIKTATMFRSYRDTVLSNLEKAHLEFSHSKKTAKDRAKYYGRVFNSVAINIGVNIVRKNLWRWTKGTIRVSALSLLIGKIEPDDEKQAAKDWLSFSADWLQEMLDFIPFTGDVFRKVRATARGDFFASKISVADNPIVGSIDDASDAIALSIKAASQVANDEVQETGKDAGQEKWFKTARRAIELGVRSAGRLTGIPSDIVVDIFKATLTDPEDRVPSRIFSLGDTSLDDIEDKETIEIRVEVLKDRGITLTQAKAMLREHAAEKVAASEKSTERRKAKLVAGERDKPVKKAISFSENKLLLMEARLESRWHGRKFVKPKKGTKSNRRSSRASGRSRTTRRKSGR